MSAPPAPLWEMVVGLEVHVQLATRSKAFCGSATDFGAAPNVNTDPLSCGLPGALPVLNAEAVRLAARAALAIGCTVHERSVFARKNYFYPDLPKGYQISQFDRPLATGGRVAIPGGPVIGVTRLHIEEDAGKSVHDRYPGVTAIDLNRAGVPLVEIVSEPDLRSAADAGAYLRELRRILVYCEVSDCSMEEGSLRCDANVSARPAGAPGLRTRTEIKNLNSFAAVEKALELEFARHCAVYEAGGTIVQQTMLWDAATGTVRPARAKEGSHDYRYFPEPDLPPLVLAPAFIAEQRAALPELPAAKRARFTGAFGLSPREAEVLVQERALAEYFEAVAAAAGDAKAAANWVTTALLAAANERGLDAGQAPRLLPAARLAALIGLVRDGALSSSAAKTVFSRLLDAPDDEPRAVAEREGLVQVGDEAQLAAWVDDVLAAMPAEAQRFLGGEQKLLGVLVGAVMKRSQGRADPRKVNQLLAARAKG